MGFFVYSLPHIVGLFFVYLIMSSNLKEWMLYIDIILLSAWVGYGGKTLYNGGTLGIGYIFIGLLTIVGIVTFFYVKRDESFLSIMSLDEEE